MIERFITMQRFTKPMQWIVLMVAAHMMLNVQSHTNVTGILGNSLTLKFTFPSQVPVKTSSHIVVHQMVIEPQKVAEYTKDKRGDAFNVHPENNSVSWHIISVTLNDSGLYWASVVSNIASKSNKVLVTIQDVNTTSTVPPSLRNSTEPEDEDGKLKTDAQILAIIAVSAIVLMAAVLPCLIWSLFGAKDLQNESKHAQGDKQEEQTQQSVNPIVQETASSVSASTPSVVYSVLEFPKRASALSDIISNNTEYANISYAEKI